MMTLKDIADSIEFNAILVRDDFTLGCDHSGKLDLSGCSYWSVILVRNGQSYTAQYSMGAAHRVYTTPNGRRGKPVQFKYNGCYSVDEYTDLGWSVPNIPEVLDVLNCLILDADSVEYNGFEEWCEEFGFNTDSIKAKKSYDQCCETRAGINRLGFRLEELQELFQDY